MIPPSAGSLVADPVQLRPPLGRSPRSPSPRARRRTSASSVESRLTSRSSRFRSRSIWRTRRSGRNCSIGSDQHPILLNPQNTDLSNAKSVGAFFSFDSNGVPDSTPGPDGALLVTGLVQGDDTFAVPGSEGAGRGSLDRWSMALPACHRRRATTTSCSTTPRRAWRSRRTARGARTSRTTGTWRSADSQRRPTSGRSTGTRALLLVQVALERLVGALDLVASLGVIGP